METNLFKVLFYLIFAIASNCQFINIKKTVTYDEHTFMEGLSQECIEEQNNSEHNECLNLITVDNYKQMCSSYKTEKCQNFYKNPLDYFPKCKDVPKIKEIYQPIIMENLKLSYELECQIDEEGNLCPMALSLILQNGGYEVLEDTCKSKICSDSAIKVLKNINLDQFSALENLSSTNGSFSYNEITSMKKVANFLESDECKYKQVKNTNNSKQDTSNASYVKINKSLLISLILLLLLKKIY